MVMDYLHPPKGQVRAHEIAATSKFGGYSGQGKGWVPTTKWKDNLVLYEWGAIVSRLLTEGAEDYRIGGMYLEFENVASAGDPVAAPAVDRSGDIEYYNDLATSADRDYLRVPLIAATITSSDESRYPKGNVTTFFAQSQGVVGTHGKNFGDTFNSTIFGAALVAFVHPTDATQDLIFSRFYFDVEDQQPKLATSQTGLEWVIPLQ